MVIGDGPIDDPADGSDVAEGDATAVGTDQTESFTDAELGSATHAAVFYRDDAGNWGLVKDIELPDRGGPDPVLCGVLVPGATNGPDVLLGSAASERIKGLAGNDKLRARGGDDCLNGGRNRDSLGGGSGNDRLNGASRPDRIRGGSGDDVIRSRDKVRDTVKCGAGEDSVVADDKDQLFGCEDVTRR